MQYMQYMVPVWSEEKKEMQWLFCGKKLYDIIMQAKEAVKEKFDTFQEPIVVLKVPHDVANGDHLPR